MAKAHNKTVLTGKSVREFLETVPDEGRRKDGFALLKLMQEASGEKPKMWGPAIIGYGVRTLKYASGRELEWLYVGFSPRKNDLTLYISGLKTAKKSLMAKLGKHKIGGGCLYIKRLSDVDEKVLRELIAASVRDIRSKA